MSQPGRQRTYDLLIGGTGFFMQGAPGQPAWDEDAIPAEVGSGQEPGDVPVRMETWHYGGGFGYSYVPGCYWHAVDMDASQPGVLTMGPSVTVVTVSGTANVSGFFEIGSKLYVLAGQYCKYINTTTNLAATPNDGANGKDFGVTNPVTVATKGIEFAGKIYIGFSKDSDVAPWSFDGTTWSNVDPDTPGVATLARHTYAAKDYLESYGWRYWAPYSTAYVKGYTSNPLQVANGNATPFTIGDTGMAITGAVGNDSLLAIGKTDGLYLFDGTRNQNVLGDMSGIVSVDNGRELLAEGETIYCPHITGLIEYSRSNGAKRWVQPFVTTGYRAPAGISSVVIGTPTAQAKFGPWHYLAVYNGTDTFICKGRYPTEGEGMPQGWVGPMIWHPIAKIASARVDCMHVSGLTSPARLWFGKGANAAYITISKTGNPLAESGMTYATSGSFYCSPLTFGATGTPDEVLQFDIENEGFSGTTYAALYVSLDGASFTQWGTTNAVTAGVSRMTLPTGTWRANRTVLRLDVTNASASSTPKIRAIVARAAPRPTYQDFVTTQIICSDDLRLRHRELERTSGASLLSTLKGFRSAGPQTIVDYLTGSARTRTCLVERVTETMLDQRGDSPAVWGAKVLLRIVRDS